ncbi:MAG: pyruvate formate lyase family protein [Eubacteriales bacterium]|nr:pyruvate formate lyase family protein [Eubacteriales bacterium]
MNYLDEERNFLRDGGQNAYRRELDDKRFREIANLIQNPELSLDMRAALRLKLFLEEEEIIRRPGERIPGWRTLRSFPDLYRDGEAKALHAGHYIHEQGRVCNISSDWEGVLKNGLLCRKTGDAARDLCIDAVLAYADRYENEALSHGLRYGVEGYLEGLQAFRILHFCLWCSNVYHNTVGRFDQYMMPYLEKDLQAKRLTLDEAQEMTEEFFLSFNRDSDLYTGMQQGDNGQSMMLGGCDADGKNAVNLLTEICLKASLHNRCIDPKINLRVNGETPFSLYQLGTELTRQGLGFPQYDNDDVVIPALVGYGYDLHDARNYTVAACWEFIIPGLGMDIPNIAALCLADAVSVCVRNHLLECKTYEAFFDQVRAEIDKRAREIATSVQSLWMEPAPWQSVLMSDYTHDISEGAKYNQYGIHGTGFSDAVDQLAVVSQFIFQEESLSKERLLEGLESNFENDLSLRKLLRGEKAPKLGRDSQCEPIADALLTAFGDAVRPLKNERGGCFRAGTGSAMYYLWHAEHLPTLCNGHQTGEKLPANFSPSLLLQDAGPLSVLRAMARPALSHAMNGGPLTLELHDTVFRTQEGVDKVARLVQSYIKLGGHQLQLNAVSPETLLDAKKHPENHRGLIVRVWGWSGHFVQLDQAYQEQIITRVSYHSVS